MWPIDGEKNECAKYRFRGGGGKSFVSRAFHFSTFGERKVLLQFYLCHRREKTFDPKKSVEFSHKSFLFFSARQKKLLNISSFQLKTFLFLQPLFFIYWGDNWRKLFSSQNGHLLTLRTVFSFRFVKILSVLSKQLKSH